MTKFRSGIVAAALMAGALPANAADLYQPEVVQAPQVEYQQPTMIQSSSSDWGDGWYIRGDIDYHQTAIRGTHYITYGPPAGTSTFTKTALGNSFSVGAGVGFATPGPGL